MYFCFLFCFKIGDFSVFCKKGIKPYSKYNINFTFTFLYLSELFFTNKELDIPESYECLKLLLKQDLKKIIIRAKKCEISIWKILKAGFIH